MNAKRKGPRNEHQSMNPSELARIRAAALYITEKCDNCGKVLNQTFHFSDGHDQKFCSDSCFTSATGTERYRRPPTQKRICEGCRKPFHSVRSDARFCTPKCQKRHARMV